MVLVAVACDPPRERRAGTEPPPETLQSIPPDAEPAARPAAKVPPQRVSTPAPALPDPLPGVRSDLTDLVGEASRAAIGDLDGDGRDEIVLADAERLRVVSAAGRRVADVPAPGGIRVLSVIDTAGRGRAIAAGWGESAQHRGAPTRLALYRLEQSRLVEDLIAAPQTTRADVVAILPAASKLLVAFFESKYVVRAAWAERGASGWTLADLATLRMATSWARGDVDGDGRPDVVVGRLYGDDQGQEGDAFLLRPDGSRVPIPTTRGVRGLALADSDGDRKDEVFLGDGWHRSYGTSARALLTWSRWDGRAFRSQTIEDIPGQFTLWNVFPADVDADGRPEIVTRGTSYVRVYRRAGSRWSGLTIAGAARDVAKGDLDGQPGDDLLVIGDRSERVSLRSVSWP